MPCAGTLKTGGFRRMSSTGAYMSFSPSVVQRNTETCIIKDSSPELLTLMTEVRLPGDNSTRTGLTLKELAQPAACSSAARRPVAASLPNFNCRVRIDGYL